MHRIIFVCHANMSRSPMAEAVMKGLVKKTGREDSFLIDSAGAGYNVGGMRMDNACIDVLRRHGIPFDPTRLSREFDRGDYDLFDMVVVMDNDILEAVNELTDGDPEGKVSLLLSHAGEDREVHDPYYTGDYETAFSDIEKGCLALIKKL